MKENKTQDNRTPASTLKVADLAQVTGGHLLLGCCTQGCCDMGSD